MAGKQSEVVVPKVLDGDVHVVTGLLIDQVPLVGHVELIVGRDAEWSFPITERNLMDFCHFGRFF